MLIVNYNSLLLKLASNTIQGVPRNMQITLNIVNDWAQVVVKSNSWPTDRSTRFQTLHTLAWLCLVNTDLRESLRLD